MSTHARSRANNRSRCPQCGARNPAAAEWCGQCLARFEPVHETEPVHQTQPVNEAEPVHETEPVHERETTSLPAAAAARQDDAASGMQAGAERAGAPPETFVVADGLVSWRCGLCDSVNPLEAAACGVCGASFAATVAPRAPAPHRDARTAAALSLLWPGVGHAYLGDWGQALARAVAGAWVTFVALLLSVSAGSGA